MSRSTRKKYPDFIRYMPRLSPGKIQKETGLPASLIKKIREGKVSLFSPSTVNKLAKLHADHWANRLTRKNVPINIARSRAETQTTIELRELYKEYSKATVLNRNDGFTIKEALDTVKRPIREQEKRIDKMHEIAERIAENRRKRDSKYPGYKPEWHSIEDVLRQMSLDPDRTSQEWDWISRHGTPTSRKKSENKVAYRKQKRRSRQYEH